MIKCVVSDLDGTLIHNSMYAIEPKTIALLKQLQANGVQLILASGRPLSMMYPVSKTLDMEKYGGVLIGSNGAQIYDCETKLESYTDATIPDELVSHIFDVASSSLSFLNIDTRDLIYTYGAPIIRHLRKIYFRMRMRTNAHGALDQHKEIRKLKDVKGAVTKLGLASFNRKAIVDLQNVLVRNYSSTVEAVRVTERYLDITPYGVNKGSAVLQVLKSKGINPDYTIAFGDGENDIAMFQVVKIGIAVGNAMENVKQNADVITEKNTEAGVRKYLESAFGQIIETNKKV